MVDDDSNDGNARAARTRAETSLALARLVGPALIAMAASLILNRTAMPELAQQISQDWATIYLSGVILLVVGIAMVERHNVWRGWPTILTLLGWLAIVGGLARMMFFRQLAGIAAGMAGHPQVVVVPALLMALLGLYLTLKGFRLLE